MKTVSIWWNDKRLKGKFYTVDQAPILLEILSKHNADKIEIKFPHHSIDIVTKAEILKILQNA